MSILYDEDKNAVINPVQTVKRVTEYLYKTKVPKIAVTCFSRTLFDNMIKAVPSKLLFVLENSALDIPVYEITINDTKITAFPSPVGAPACINNYEELVELGVEYTFMFGTCGVLNRDISECSIIIPTSSIREEGTSYHYEKDSQEIEMDKTFIKDFENFLTKKDIIYTKGKNWTTDAFYRETKNKLKQYQTQGVISVDMEASAMSVVSKFRNVHLLHFFYSADNLDNEEWDKRSLACSDNLDEKLKIWQLLFDFILSIKNQLK